MATGKFDIPDAALSPLFVIFSMVTLGLVPAQYFGVDLSSSVLEFTASSGQTTVISIAMVGSLAVLAYAYYTNRQDISSMERVEMWIVVGTVALILAPPFVPIISELLNGTVASWLALVVISGGYYSLSFAG